MFTMTINTENAAFTDNSGHEVARILRETADRLERGKRSSRVSDINGNAIGRFDLTQEG